MDQHSTPAIGYPAFQGLFIPYRLQMVLAGSMEDFTTHATRDAEATYLHESVHWWQTAMTGYGHTAWHLFRQLGGWRWQPLALRGPGLRLHRNFWLSQ